MTGRHPHSLPDPCDAMNESGDVSPSQARGFAARHLLAEDARWVADIVWSSQDAGECQAYPALLLGHHFVRIAYEGTKTLRSDTPDVGCPELADLIRDQYADITSRARHMSKLLDDTQKSDTDVLNEMRAAYNLCHQSLTGNARRGFRWLETDLGLYLMQGRVVGASTPIAYRLGLDPSNPHVMGGESLTAVTHEWGGAMAVLASADLEPPREHGTLTLGNCGITYKDKLTSRYLARSYEPDFPVELKLFLLMIEADLNANRLYLPLTEHGHEGSTFRARAVTVYHSLTALRRVLNANPSVDTARTRTIRAFLDSAATQRLLSPAGKHVRNRSVHYEIPNPTIRPDFAQPMLGLVEAVNPGTTFVEFNTDVQGVSDQLSQLLSDWRHGSRST